MSLTSQKPRSGLTNVTASLSNTKSDALPMGRHAELGISPFGSLEKLQNQPFTMPLALLGKRSDFPFMAAFQSFLGDSKS